MKYIDLSHDIKNGMPVYPGDEEVIINNTAIYEEKGYNSITFKGNMHVGTHVDVPMHMLDNKNYINSIELEKFIGKALLLDVRGEKNIRIKDEYYRKIKENDIVLLYTGFEKYYGSKEYYENHPVLTEEFAEFLVKKKIKMLGFDMPSPDREPYKIHKLLLENEIFILENLKSLNKLLYDEEFTIFAQPLKIEAEASLVRAIAVCKNY